MHAYLWCFSVLFKIVRPISGESSTKLPIWGHHTQIHRFYGIKRWNTMRKKISDPYKPRKKCSRHAHESIKPRLYGTGALEVGAEKIFLELFMSSSWWGPVPCRVPGYQYSTWMYVKLHVHVCMMYSNVQVHVCHVYSIRVLPVYPVQACNFWR